MRAEPYLVCAVVLSCAPTKPAAFVEASAAAERQYSAGRYGAAAQSWERAARATERASDREEAMYRVATSRQRAGDERGARIAYQDLLRTYPEGSRAPRAAYELASMELEHQHDARALELYVQVMERYPDSGIAERALDRCLGGILLDAELDTQLEFLQRLDSIKSPELREKVGYERARLLYAHERFSEAKQEFLRVAREFPYPKGAYWDDALWYAADIDRQSREPKAALGLLRRMLAERESAHFQGSYTRPRYAEAQFRIAEIYRDDLDEPSHAMRAFRRVFSEYPTSLLRDDALWQEARVAQSHGMQSQACDAIDQLLESLPESRFVGCARELCPDAAPPQSRPCRPYIRRELAGSTATVTPPPDSTSEVQSSK